MNVTMNRILDRQFVYFDSSSHSGANGLAAFKERMAERQRIADRERRDREHAEERAYDEARELLDRSRG